MEKILNIVKKIIPQKLFKAFQPIYHFLLSGLAALFYGQPSRKLIVIGVTGTTGKTTTVYLIAKMLNQAGFKTGYTSTAMFNDGQKEWLNNKKMTMVGRFFTQKIIRQMIRNNCRYAVIEATSEGIRQYRHYFINFDILIFTGLYPEHIDSHGSFEKYKQAKGKLFKHLKNCRTKYINEQKQVVKTKTEIKKLELARVKKTIIANGNDEQADYFLNFWAEQKFVITDIKQEIKAAAKIKADILEYGLIKADNKGTVFACGSEQISLKLLGAFNADNAMNGLAVGISQAINIKDLKNGLEKIEGVPGRLEKIDLGQKFTVIVDYAFEPKAATKLYETVKNIPHKKIIHLLGSAGGGRDVDRRPMLGELAGSKADYVVATNEDPYDDDPSIIIDQVALGAEKAGKKVGINLFKILDRREAIAKAISLADEKDLVLITGKGCEQAICGPNGKKIKWDDRQEAKEAIKKGMGSQ